jgi:hypothetical protein
MTSANRPRAAAATANSEDKRRYMQAQQRRQIRQELEKRYQEIKGDA